MRRKFRGIWSTTLIAAIAAVTGACGADDSDALAGADEQAMAGQHPPKDHGPTTEHENEHLPVGVATGPRSCEPVKGTFTNQFIVSDVDCPNSPIGRCTSGHLFGDLTGDYAFNFLSESPVGASTAAPNDEFTGRSVITLGDSTIFGQDFGVLRQNALPLADFTTHLRITGGTGAFEGATGHLTIQGLASFLNGKGSGTYHGVICVPR